MKITDNNNKTIINSSSSLLQLKKTTENTKRIDINIYKKYLRH